jgi:carbon storage regulator CsrA
VAAAQSQPSWEANPALWSNASASSDRIKRGFAKRTVNAIAPVSLTNGFGAAGRPGPRGTPTTAWEARMLVLSRKKDEQLVIRLGDQTVVIRILGVVRERVRVGIVADPSVIVHREEVARRILDWQQDIDALLAEPVAKT